MNLPSGSDLEGTTIVVDDALAARQWELTLAAAQHGSAWVAPEVVGYGRWLETLWAGGPEAAVLPLSPGQSSALWRHVIEDSADSHALVGQAGVATWAGEAWRLLHQWRIEVSSLRAASDESDFGAFLGWSRHYHAALRDRGVTDRAEIESRLADRPPATLRPTLAAGLKETYPARTQLLRALAERDAPLAERTNAPVAAQCRSAVLADAADELRTALAWAHRRLEQEPTRRVAVVVAGLRGRATEVERAVAAEFGPVAPPVWLAGRALGADPAIGAASTALALLGAGADYATLGRWLRSPFFASAEAEGVARADADARLRAELRSQLPFRRAYEECGLRDWLRERVPQSAAALATALAERGRGTRLTPGRWAHIFTRALAALGWQAPHGAGALLGWQAALDELMRLTAVVGAISLEEALRALDGALSRPAPTPMPLHGLHVLEAIDDVGPGYAAVWATGFTDAYWPEAPRGNPLLPRRLQRAHGLPMSSPSDARERAARRFERFAGAAPDIVVSWPTRVFDYDAEPSPAIRSWTRLPVAGIEARAVPARPRETVPDPAPALAGAELPGGAAMLTRQSRCPVRAFAQDRLGARELLPLGFGLPARLRGIAVHEAAELLMRDLPAQSDLPALTAVTAQCSERALARVFGRSAGPLRALFEIETDQLRATLEAFLALELERAPFRVSAIEERREATLGRFRLRLRLDRLDRLADGRLAIIDYKTGKRATSADWFTRRLRDVQVPLYAVTTAEPIAAAVIARLRGADTAYFGLWPEGAFPGRGASTRAAEWNVQVDRWRRELETLAEEFAAGDVRVFVGDYDDARGAFAPLTRIHERLGLVRGSVTPW